MPELVVRPQKIKVFGRPGGGVRASAAPDHMRREIPQSRPQAASLRDLPPHVLNSNKVLFN